MGQEVLIRKFSEKERRIENIYMCMCAESWW